MDSISEAITNGVVKDYLATVNKTAGSFNRLIDNIYNTEGNVKNICIMSGFRNHKYDYGTKDNKPTWESLPGKETDEIATLHDNILRNDILEERIRDAGLGFKKAVGGYNEKHTDEAGSTDVEKVSEYSFVIYNTKFTEDEFRKAMIKFGVKFDQDTILMIYTEGKGEKIRDIRENRTPKKYNERELFDTRTEYEEIDGVKFVKNRKYPWLQAEYIATSVRAGTIGTVVNTFNSLNTAVNEYFTKIFDKKFELKKIISSAKAFYSLEGANSGPLKSAAFEESFPELAVRRERYIGNRHLVSEHLLKLYDEYIASLKK